MDDHGNGVAREWRTPDGMWDRIEPLLLMLPRPPEGGRPWIDHRKIADGLFYVLRTGCQGKAEPRPARRKQNMCEAEHVYGQGL
jgi:transposase